MEEELKTHTNRILESEKILSSYIPTSESPDDNWHRVNELDKRADNYAESLTELRKFIEEKSEAYADRLEQLLDQKDNEKGRKDALKGVTIISQVAQKVRDLPMTSPSKQQALSPATKNDLRLLEKADRELLSAKNFRNGATDLLAYGDRSIVKRLDDEFKGDSKRIRPHKKRN